MALLDSLLMVPSQVSHCDFAVDEEDLMVRSSPSSFVVSHQAGLPIAIAQ